MKAQRFPYLPVPVCTQAISPAIPDTKDKPRKSCKQHGNQVQLSCFRKNPAGDIKQSKYCMKGKEKNIENLEPHLFRIDYSLTATAIFESAVP